MEPPVPESDKKLLKENGSDTDLSEEFKPHNLTEEDFEDFLPQHTENSFHSREDFLEKTFDLSKAKARKASVPDV